MNSIAPRRPTLRLHPPLWLGAAALLMVPLAAMQVTRAVVWDAADFAAFALLLTGFCLGVEGALMALASPLHRLAAVLAAFAAFAAVWAELAVGIVN